MTTLDSGERCPHGCSSRASCPYCTPSLGAHGNVTPLADSGEREVRRWEALHDGHTVTCEEAAHRKGHENVCICEAKESKILRRCAKVGCNLIASGVLAGDESPFCEKHMGKRKNVSVPLPLVQRTIAALDDPMGHECSDIAAELRAIVERKP